MCKYCKRLKELIDLDKKEYERVINAWKRRDLKARKLVADLYLRLHTVGIFADYKHDEIVSFLDFNCLEVR